MRLVGTLRHRSGAAPGAMRAQLLAKGFNIWGRSNPHDSILFISRQVITLQFRTANRSIRKQCLGLWQCHGRRGRQIGDNRTSNFCEHKKVRFWLECSIGYRCGVSTSLVCCDPFGRPRIHSVGFLIRSFSLRILLIAMTLVAVWLGADRVVAMTRGKMAA